MIDKAREGATVEREIVKADAIEKRFDEIGRELGTSLAKGKFAWATA